MLVIYFTHHTPAIQGVWNMISQGSEYQIWLPYRLHSIT